MQGVFEGFATIGVIIALGVLLAQLGVLDLTAQKVLSRLSFFVASPALMVLVLGSADVTSVLSKSLAATATAVLVCAALYLVAARWVWRKPVADATIGTMSAVYVNAGNLGLPIAAYVLGDAALVAPTLLMQLLVLQPLALAVTGVELPRAIEDPLVLVGGMAVPSMLLAYGISLRLGPRPGHGSSALEIGYFSVLKLVVQPLSAYVAGRFVLDLEA